MPGERPQGDREDRRSPLDIPLDIFQRSYEASRASRLLDVSPPHLGMSGLTSDSDFAPPQQTHAHAPVKRRDLNNKDREAQWQSYSTPAISYSSPRPRSVSGDSEREATAPAPDAPTDDMDEWDFSEALDSDGQPPSQRAESSTQAWAAVTHDKVYIHATVYFSF